MSQQSPIKLFVGLAFVGYAVGLFIFTLWLAGQAPAPKPGALARLADTPPDFAAFTDVNAKKQAFYDYLLPGIHHHNQRLAEARQDLLAIKAKQDASKSLSKQEQRQLQRLFEQYKTQDMATLLRRVDQIPASLAIAQAATESGWGSSRFAQEGNNFYGQWCFERGCGLVPSRRKEGATHEVRQFDTPAASIGAYFRNINTHPAYRELRRIREQLRQQGQPLTGKALSRGLLKYSERGQDYVDDIQTMIRINDLQQLDAAQG